MNEHLSKHKDMYERHKKGESISSLAAEYWLSDTRIRQMIRRWEKELEKEPKAKICQGCRKIIDQVYDFPWVEKHWGKVKSEELQEDWHTPCFVIWHSAHVNLSPQETAQLVQEKLFNG